MNEFEFCWMLPKVELHAHLNGSLSADILEKLGCSKEDKAEFLRLTTHKNDNPLEKCFTLFRITHGLTKTKDAVYQATKLLIDEFYKENVIYLELRTTPRQETNMTKEEYIESVVKGIQDSNKNLLTKLLLSIDRSHKYEDSKESINLIIKMKEKYPDIIKGVDFSGNPTVSHFKKDLFMLARENGLSLSLHCAEVKNDEEIEEILKFKPDRIGHGTFIHPINGGCDNNWNLYKAQNIPLECCLTSNVLCGTVQSYKQHHLQEWIKNSLPYCLCTDDKGVFATSLSKELFLSTKYLNLNKEDLWKMTLNAVDFSFSAEAEKVQLREQLKTFKSKNNF